MPLPPGKLADNAPEPSNASSPIFNDGVEPVKTAPACRRCGARKVKCDRVQPVCGACHRFGHSCSFSRSSASLSPDVENASDGTQAGIKRKRTRQACESCRVRKAKCSGIGPCERCLSKGIACDLPPSAIHQAVDDRIRSIPPVEILGRRTVTTASTVSSWPLDKATTRNYLDAYFNIASRTVPTFLHKPSVLADWGKGVLDQNLLECVVAVGFFVSDPRPEGQAMARAWIQKVQDDVLKRIGRQTFAQLSTVVVLLRFRLQFGDSADAWSLLALAARSAFTMRLNHERDELDPITQESHRRLAWTIYQIDRLCSGGVEDLAVCPVERMHIRLPCDERSFEVGIPSKSGFLDGRDFDLNANVDAHAFKLVLLATRDKVLSYTKYVRRRGKSPCESRPQMESLQAELDSFEQILPPELKLTSQRLAVMGHSYQAGTYAGLHSLWLMCHCDLYRFCVPGIRESVSADALASTPREFVDYCQQRCLSNAVQLCGLWSNLYHLESSEFLGDEFLAVSVYQVTQILHHLPHLLPDEGDNCMASLKKKLIEVLKLASPLKQIYNSTIGCLKDAERLVEALGRGTTVRLSPDSNTVEGMEAVEQHLVSRHTILPRLYRNQDARDEEGYQTVEGTRPGAISHSRDAAVSSYPVKQHNSLERESRVGQDVEQGMSDLFLWDPFNMQLNGYYDPDLNFSFV
ncbi:hypothetical protein BJX99DRAFT_251533 [Aspergillus californicus]